MEESTDKPIELKPGNAHLTIGANDEVVVLDIVWRDIVTIKEGQENDSLTLKYDRKDFIEMLRDAKIEAK